MKKIMFAAIIAAMLCLVGCDEANTNDTVRVNQQSEAGRFETDCGGFCAVITDTETGVQYLFYQCGYGGGLTALLNADGTPDVAEDVE